MANEINDVNSSFKNRKRGCRFMGLCQFVKPVSRKWIPNERKKSGEGKQIRKKCKSHTSTNDFLLYVVFIVPIPLTVITLCND